MKTTFYFNGKRITKKRYADNILHKDVLEILCITDQSESGDQSHFTSEEVLYQVNIG